MPTILRLRGYAFRLHLNDHPPPHVHVVGPDGWALVELGTGRLIRHRGLARKDLVALIAIVFEHGELLREARHDLHAHRKCNLEEREQA